MKTLIVLICLLSSCISPFGIESYTHTLTVITGKESTLNFYYDNVFDCSRQVPANSETEFYFNFIVTVKYENESFILTKDTTIYLGK